MMLGNYSKPVTFTEWERTERAQWEKGRKGALVAFWFGWLGFCLMLWITSTTLVPVMAPAWIGFIQGLVAGMNTAQSIRAFAFISRAKSAIAELDRMVESHSRGTLELSWIQFKGG